jgi:hypothetical protein
MADNFETTDCTIRINNPGGTLHPNKCVIECVADDNWTINGQPVDVAVGRAALMIYTQGGFGIAFLPDLPA